MINRLLMRVALVNALTHRMEGSDIFPTIAGDRVFDTRIVPDQLDVGAIEMPLCCVYSLETVMSDDKTGKSARFNGRNYIQTFVIELTVVVYEEDPTIAYEGPTPPRQLMIVENDAELAAVLDLFEAQVWRTLHDQMNPWSKVFGKLTRNAFNYKSDFEADGEKNNKRALRRITLECEICTDPLPTIGISDTGSVQVQPGIVPGERFSIMDTYIGPTIENLLAQPDTRSIVAGLRSTLGDGDSILLPGLKRVGIVARGDRTDDDPGGVVLARQEMKVEPQ